MYDKQTESLRLSF